MTSVCGRKTKVSVILFLFVCRNLSPPSSRPSLLALYLLFCLNSHLCVFHMLCLCFTQWSKINFRDGISFFFKGALGTTDEHNLDRGDSKDNCHSFIFIYLFCLYFIIFQYEVAAALLHAWLSRHYGMTFNPFASQSKGYIKQTIPL